MEKIIEQLKAQFGELKGSEKQIAWAEKIRASFFEADFLQIDVRRFVRDYQENFVGLRDIVGEKSQAELQQYGMEALTRIARMQSAAWWIDNRERLDMDGMTAVVRNKCGDMDWYESRVN